jgi:hypothetical protein
LFCFVPSLYALLQGNEIVLVDDYDDQDFVNLLQGESRGDADCTVGFASGEEALGGEGASLSLAYRLTEPGTFSYFRVKWEADLSEMRYLSFWVKRSGPGPASGAGLSVEVHEDTNGDKQFNPGTDKTERLPVNRFTVRKREDGWEKIVIPLSDFRRIREWGRVPEIHLIFESKRSAAEAKFLIDNLLFGSNYPEGLNVKEILMQNRVSSFKIEGELADSGMKLKRGKNRLALSLTFIDPYLEEIRFEESRDGGKRWKRIRSFYNHFTGGAYPAEWSADPTVPTTEGLLLRAIGVDLLGGESELAGPYHANVN